MRDDALSWRSGEEGALAEDGEEPEDGEGESRARRVHARRLSLRRSREIMRTGLQSR